MSSSERDSLSEAIIGAAIEVHRILGPGLLEEIYQKAMTHELLLRDIPFRSQAAVKVEYKGVLVGDHLRLDLVVNDEIIVELKSVEKLHPIHEAQLMTYLKLTGIHKGLLINFNEVLLKNGIRRRVYGDPLLPRMRPSWLHE